MARRRGRTKSEILREAILRLAAREDIEPGESFLDAVRDLVGIGSGKPPDLARRSEEICRERLLTGRRRRR
jgi:hypothetical protein